MTQTSIPVNDGIAVDTSIAVPLLVASHTQHRIVAHWARGRKLLLSGHALAETYAVLTRLPGDSRVAPQDAARLIEERFEYAIPLSDTTAGVLHILLADAGISGGAVYDAMVALAASDHDVTLATRDARARATYEAVGIKVEFVA